MFVCARLYTYVLLRANGNITARVGAVRFKCVYVTCMRARAHVFDAHRCASGTPLFMKRSNFFPARSYPARNVPLVDARHLDHSKPSSDSRLLRFVFRSFRVLRYLDRSEIAQVNINNDFYHVRASCSVILKNRRDKNLGRYFREMLLLLLEK